METLQRQPPKPSHFSRLGSAGFEFDPTALEVVILDRVGRPVWQKKQGAEPAPIRWSGIDSFGHLVETGDYICKLVFPNNRVSYSPFVFMKQ